MKVSKLSISAKKASVSDFLSGFLSSNSAEITEVTRYTLIFLRIFIYLLGMAYNVPGISEVPSEARNLDGALAKSDMHLLGDPVRGEQRKWRSVSLGGLKVQSPFNRLIGICLTVNFVGNFFITSFLSYPASETTIIGISIK